MAWGRGLSFPMAARGAALALLLPHPIAAQAMQAGLSVPPQPLEAALLALARQTGRNILFSREAVRGMVSRPVRAGDFDSALRQMLAGLPLRVTRRGHAVTIVPAPLPAQPRDARPPRPAARPALPPPPKAETILVQGYRPRGEADELRNYAGDTLDSATARRLPDRNLAETLARVPGVLSLTTNLQGDLGGNDRAARAEGQFVAIRGLGGAYNVARIDGIAIPQSMPYGRDAQLGLLPAAGFSSVTVVKAVGPELAGDATGGTIEFRSPTAEGTAPRGLSLSFTGGLDDRALSYGQDGSYAALAAGLVARLGPDERLGIAVTGQFARRAFANSQQTYQRGQVEFALVDAEGHSAPGFDPAENLLLTGVNAQFTRGTTRTANLLSSLDYRLSDHVTVFTRFAYAGASTEQEIYQIGFQGGRDESYVARTPVGGGIYAVRSIASDVHYWYQTNPERSEFALAQTGVALALGRTSATIRLHAAHGRSSRPDHIETSFWDPLATRQSEGLTLDYIHGYPVPVLNAADRALAAGILDYPYHNIGELRTQRSSDRQIGLDATAATRFDTGALRSLEAGFALSRDRRAGYQRNFEALDTYPPGSTLRMTGLADGRLGAVLPGIYDFAIPLIDGGRFATLLDAAHFAALSPDAYNNQTVTGTDDIAAAWVVARLAFGALELAPGLRGEASWIRNRYWVAGNQGVDADGVDYGWNRGRSRFAALLPSLFARLAAAEGLALRAGLWASYARPSVGQLAGTSGSAPDADGTLVLTRANPDLKAVRALNLDLGAEWAGAGGGQLSAAFFAKRLRHYLYDAGGGFVALAPQGGEGLVRIIEPANGGTASILGLELHASLPLPGLTGWTIGGDATLLRTRVRLRNPLLDAVERVQNAPDYNLTARIGFESGGWSALAAARWTGAYVQEYGLFGTSLSGWSELDGSAFDVWVRPSRQIDLSLGRALGGTRMLRLFVRNAADDRAFRNTIGRYSDKVPQAIDSGRLIGVKLEQGW